jgi:hypothetical protein
VDRRRLAERGLTLDELRDAVEELPYVFAAGIMARGGRYAEMFTLQASAYTDTSIEGKDAEVHTQAEPGPIGPR